MAAFIRRSARRGDYYAPNSAGIARLLRVDAKAATTDDEVWHVRDQVKAFAAARTITEKQSMSVYKILEPKMGLEPGAHRRGARHFGGGSLAGAFGAVAMGIGATNGPRIRGVTTAGAAALQAAANRIMPGSFHVELIDEYGDRVPEHAATSYKIMWETGSALAPSVASGLKTLRRAARQYV